jgi:hypothetical protein
MCFELPEPARRVQTHMSFDRVKPSRGKLSAGKDNQSQPSFAALSVHSYYFFSFFSFFWMWSSGMICASGAQGLGFDSPYPPFFSFFFFVARISFPFSFSFFACIFRSSVHLSHQAHIRCKLVLPKTTTRALQRSVAKASAEPVHKADTPPKTNKHSHPTTPPPGHQLVFLNSSAIQPESNHFRSYPGPPAVFKLTCASSQVNHLAPSRQAQQVQPESNHLRNHPSNSNVLDFSFCKIFLLFFFFFQYVV